MIPILIHFIIITAIIIIIIRSIAMIFLGLLFLCWLCVQLPNRSKTEVWEKSWGFWGYALSDPNVAKLPTIPTKKLHLTLSVALSTKFSLKYLKIIYIQAWKVTFLWISQITAHNAFFKLYTFACHYSHYWLFVFDKKFSTYKFTSVHCCVLGSKTWSWCSHNFGLILVH